MHHHSTPLRMGHFARECPTVTGVPVRGARRDIAPYSRGRPSDYGTSKCLKCNK